MGLVFHLQGRRASYTKMPEWSYTWFDRFRTRLAESVARSTRSRFDVAWDDYDADQMKRLASLMERAAELGRELRLD